MLSFEKLVALTVKGNATFQKGGNNFELCFVTVSDQSRKIFFQESTAKVIVFNVFLFE
jgi:hypothetical protein